MCTVRELEGREEAVGVSELWCRRFARDGPVWVAFTVDDIRTLADKAGLRVLTAEDAECIAVVLDAAAQEKWQTAMQYRGDKREQEMDEAAELERLARTLRREEVTEDG